MAGRFLYCEYPNPNQENPSSEWVDRKYSKAVHINGANKIFSGSLSLREEIIHENKPTKVDK